MTPISPSSSQRHIAGWLFFCAFSIYCMIVLGGVTRLTESGLSMVEWQPLIGIIPPIGDEQWQASFEKYQQFPEYQKKNHGMSLAEYKNIFVFEYAHRMLGRLIGVFFFVPFMYFLIRKRIDKTLAPKLWALFILGGLQGFMGWYMVKSGLVDMPRVSQYRLTAHLGLAVIIYSYMLWVAFDLVYPRAAATAISRSGMGSLKIIKSWALCLSGLIFLMILSGGLVAGLDAGFAYNTFPLMDGRFVPVGAYGLEPAWLSMFNDITTVQFNHRVFAYVIMFLVLVFVIIALKKGVSGRLRTGVIVFPCLLILQVSLGILTLIHIVPVPLAAAHQAGAIALLTVSLFVSHAVCMQRDS